jgi:glutamate racemase
MFDNRPILIFDSGVGGLSILSHIRAALPQASLVYAADNSWYPYGTRSEAEIAARVPAVLGRLAERYRPRVVVIACNTAATIALSDVRAALDLPVVGTVPAIKPAARASTTRVIGVLGTAATIRQPYVDRLSEQFARDCTVVRLGSAELVRIAESKLRGVAPPATRLRFIMNELFSQPEGDKIDQVVLACTHFPLLAAEIAAASPPGISFVDSGAGIARRTAYLTDGQDWPERASGRAVFTRPGEDVTTVVPALAEYGLTEVETL